MGLDFLNYETKYDGWIMTGTLFMTLWLVIGFWTTVIAILFVGAVLMSILAAGIAFSPVVRREWDQYNKDKGWT